MRTATGVILTIGVLAGLAYFARTSLPSSPVFTLNWNAQEIFIPFNIAVFWGCAMTGGALVVFEALRAMMRDVVRLR